MRKVTEITCRAFDAGEPVTVGNTAVTVDPDGGAGPIVRMYLHGNLIAESCNGMTRVTLAGWPTATTRDRLNGLADVLTGSQCCFYQSRHAQYFADASGAREINAHEWIVIHREPAFLRRQAS